MQKVLTLLLCIAFIAVLYVGQSHWNEKITGASAQNKSAVKVEQGETVAEEPIDDKLQEFTGNWPKQASARFKEKLTAGVTFKILFVGSPAIGSEKDGVYPLVKQQLLETYGKEHIEVGLKTYNATSSFVMKEKKPAEIAAEQADLIVLEPFILKNNGLISIDDTFKDLKKLIADVQEANPETTFIIQPSYPVYKASIYPKQTDQLKDFAEENGFTYLDHWTSWPDYTTDEIKSYLTPEGPSDKGAQVWSDYLSDYFIKKGES
jgi:hypothetical protein